MLNASKQIAGMFTMEEDGETTVTFAFDTTAVEDSLFVMEHGLWVGLNQGVTSLKMAKRLAHQYLCSQYSAEPEGV